MRTGLVVLLAMAVMTTALLAASCGAEPAPLVVPTMGDSPDAVSAPAVEQAADRSGEVEDEPEIFALPVISPESFELTGVQGWINSDPLTIKGLTDEGKVVLVDFWTYT